MGCYIDLALVHMGCFNLAYDVYFDLVKIQVPFDATMHLTSQFH